MDYEQKYKDLVKAVKELREANPSDEGIQNWVNENCPELKESRDEKIRKVLVDFFKSYKEQGTCGAETFNGISTSNILAWLEMQGKCETVCHRSHQDANHPNGCIVLEDFNASEGFYKVHLDYLSRKQVEVVEEMVRAWNNDSKVPDEDIKSCIGMCLTDANEQRFKDYNTSLKDCLAWLEMQGGQEEPQVAEPKFKVGDWVVSVEAYASYNMLVVENRITSTNEFKEHYE